ncbi:nucleoside deaminase [bacterium]|nr:nucleoside deaminase [bacterium]
MREALGLAERAADEGEVPVGCVIVRGEAIVGRGRNRREATQDPTAHAEIVALREAAATLGSWRLDGCDLYVTLEPCAMCAGAMVLARVARCFFAARDPKAGAVETLFRIADDPRLNHRVAVEGGILAEESAELLRNFFQERRRPE